MHYAPFRTLRGFSVARILFRWFMFLYPGLPWVLRHRLSPGMCREELPALVLRLTVTFMFEPAFLLIDISSKPVGIWATKKREQPIKHKAFVYGIIP